MEASPQGWLLGRRGSQRERDYIAALEVFYKDHDKLDHQARTFAYSDAMKQLHESNPADREAGVFYALTLIATGMMSRDKSYVREKQAAQILNGVLAREPHHLTRLRVFVRRASDRGDR